MSGEPSLKVEELWQQTEKLLEDYKKKLQVQIQANPEIEKVLNLTEQELNNLDANTSRTYAFLLVQYSMYLQQEYNLHSAKYKWCDHNLNTITGRLAKDYSQYMKWEEKKACIVKENSYAKVLNDFLRETMVYMETLNGLSKKVESLGYILRRYEH